MKRCVFVKTRGLVKVELIVIVKGSGCEGLRDPNYQFDASGLVLLSSD